MKNHDSYKKNACIQNLYMDLSFQQKKNDLKIKYLVAKIYAK